jgi:hypothetical protein
MVPLAVLIEAQVQLIQSCNKEGLQIFELEQLLRSNKSILFTRGRCLFFIGTLIDTLKSFYDTPSPPGG